MGNKISLIRRRQTTEGSNYYLFRINDVQIDRIQQMHHILNVCCKGNYLSPITKDLKRGIKVLDIGSGPGTWLFNMSSDFPNSEFIGVEVQEFMLPTVHPNNTKFIHNNVLDGIPFSPNSFDYIHMRCMLLCFTEQQYEQVIKDLLVLLKPNGYLELAELAMNSSNLGPVAEVLSTECAKLLRARNLNPFMLEQLNRLMTDCRLQDIVQEEAEIPVGGDGIGGVYAEVTINAISAIKETLAKQMNISKSEMDTILNNYREELKTRRMYTRYVRIYGRKPSSP